MNVHAVPYITVTMGLSHYDDASPITGRVAPRGASAAIDLDNGRVALVALQPEVLEMLAAEATKTADAMRAARAEAATAQAIA